MTTTTEPRARCAMIETRWTETTQRTSEFANTTINRIFVKERKKLHNHGTPLLFVVRMGVAQARKTDDFPWILGQHCNIDTCNSSHDKVRTIDLFFAVLTLILKNISLCKFVCCVAMQPSVPVCLFGVVVVVCFLFLGVP